MQAAQIEECLSVLITIDRIEGDFAVAELPDKTFINLPTKLLPDVKEGDVYEVVKAQTEMAQRESRINDKFNRLKK